jgi:hypothetical protein
MNTKDILILVVGTLAVMAFVKHVAPRIPVAGPMLVAAVG